MVSEISLENLARQYVDSYLRWISGNGIMLPREDFYYLLDYCLQTIYEIPCPWYTEGIAMYGTVCINWLLNSVPTVCQLTYEGRVSLVAVAHSYFIACCS